MSERQDPEGEIYKAEDGKLAVRITGEITAPVDSEDIGKEKGWEDMNKKELDEYAEVLGINLNRSKTLENMQKDFQSELDKKESKDEESEDVEESEDEDETSEEGDSDTGSKILFD